MRRFCLESTIWHNVRDGQGYLGAYLQRGFASGLLLQIAESLRRSLPRVFQNASLSQMWAYSYDPEYSGTEAAPRHPALNRTLVPQRG